MHSFEPEQQFPVTLTPADRRLLANNGEEFRAIRKTIGLSREDLAERAGLHINTVGFIERGERNVSVLTQIKLFAAIGSTRILVRPDGYVPQPSELKKASLRKDILGLHTAVIVRDIGNVIRNRRMACGCSLEEIAERAGVHRNTLWNYELGLVCPSSLTIQRIYLALGVCELTYDRRLHVR